MPMIHICQCQGFSVRALTVGIPVTDTRPCHLETCEETPRGREGFLTTLKYKKGKCGFIQARE